MKAVLFDGPGCVGCRACENACKTKYNLPPLDMSGALAGTGETLPAEPTTNPKTMTEPPQLSAYTWIKVRQTEIDIKGDPRGYHVDNTLRKCMHCIDPACVAACPVGAMHKTADGTATVYDDKKCIGCRYCMLACPFGVPTFQWDQPVAYVRKCIFCSDLLEQGKNPACVDACAKRTKCITIGERSAQIAKAHQMIADGNKKAPGTYVDHVYGEFEVGGTNWIFLAGDPFEMLGLRTYGSTLPAGNVTSFEKKIGMGANWGNLSTFSKDPVPTYAKKAMESVPYVLPGVAVVMTGLFWVFKRKDQLSQERADAKGKKEVKK